MLENLINLIRNYCAGLNGEIRNLSIQGRIVRFDISGLFEGSFDTVELIAPSTEFNVDQSGWIAAVNEGYVGEDYSWRLCHPIFMAMKESALNMACLRQREAKIAARR